MERLDLAARIVARDCVRLRAGESAVLLSDPEVDPIVPRALLEAMRETDASVRALTVSFDVPGVAQEFPDPELAEQVRDADAVIAAVSQSLTYNRTLAAMRARGGRVLSLPRIGRAALERVVETDMAAMAELTRRVVDQLTGCKTLELRSPAGTRLVLDVSGNAPDPIDGVVGPGEIDQIPAGVVSIVGRAARGRIVVTGPLSALDEVDRPITLQIEDSRIVTIDGGESARRFTALLDALDDPSARHCPAEVGVGTNPSVTPGPSRTFVPEFARAPGAVHVGFGDDHLFPGGTVVAPIHGDFLLPDAEVWLDGRRLDLGQ